MGQQIHQALAAYGGLREMNQHYSPVARPLCHDVGDMARFATANDPLAERPLARANQAFLEKVLASIEGHATMRFEETIIEANVVD